MSLFIGQRVEDENASGTIVGFYNPDFYFFFFIKNNEHIKKFGEAWKRFTGWIDEPLVIVYYDKPVKTMTRQEVSDYTKIPLDLLTDEIYNTFAKDEQVMVLPQQAVQPSMKG